MVKNYTLSFLFLLIVMPPRLYSQEIKIFKSTDFDLTGKVKSCLVITDYGKEEYDFDQDGLLTKSVTRYNDDDYDVTYYKYKDGELLEKRLENYRDKVFDKTTSIANFYTIDTTAARKVVEKIVSYEKTFLDQYEYLYDSENKLVKIIRTNEDGNDETSIDYNTYGDEQTISYILNGVLQKSVRTSHKKGKDKTIENVVLTKKFLNGEPNTAMEEIFDTHGKIKVRTNFVFDEKKGQFSPESIEKYTYDAAGILTKLETTVGETVEVKKYIHQFDNGETGNWVKQIITPDNAYTTRKITYYPAENTAVEKE